MTFIVKLNYKGYTRRLTFAEQPTWAVLAAKIVEIFRVNKDAVAVSYFDAESDQITLSSEGELADYYAHYLREGEIAHLVLQVPTAPPVTQVREDDTMTDLLKDVPIPKSANSESEWQDVQSPGRAVDDARSDTYGSTFWNGLEEAFMPANARLYEPEGANIIASFAAVRTNPDVLFDISRHLSPRSTATLIQVLDDSDASDTELDFLTGGLHPVQAHTRPAPPAPPTPPPPPVAAVSPTSPTTEKGKAKEVAFDHTVPTANVSSAQSVRGSAADPKEVEVPAPSVLPELAAAPEPVAAPVIPEPAVVPPVEAKPTVEVAPDPPIPTVPPVTVIPTVPAPELAHATAPASNLIADIAGLINAFQTVLQTQPDIGASLRRFIRSAVVEGSPPIAETEKKEASVSAAQNDSPAQLKEVIKTLKDSIAAQSAVDPTEDRTADFMSEAPTHSRGPLYQPPPGPPPQPQAEHGRRHRRPSSRQSHRSRVPPPPPPPPLQMGGGPIPQPGPPGIVSSIRGLPPPMPPPPPGTAMGVWLAPADRMSPFLYYQPFVPHDGVPPPPPPLPPHHHHGHHHHKHGRHGTSRRERSPSRRSISSPFHHTVAPPAPAPQGFMPPPPPPRLPPPAEHARMSPVPAISVVPGPASVPTEQQAVTVPRPAPPDLSQPLSHEEALAALSERKTQLELAKEHYRLEKQKWREEKEARRAARDREIERLTGRRVLSHEERQTRQRLELEESPVVVAPVVPSVENPYANLDKKVSSGETMFGLFGSAGLNFGNPAESRPRPARPTTLTEPPPYAGPQTPSPRNRNRASTGATPTSARPGRVSPIQDLKPGGAMATTAQAERLIDRLEDMGFSPSTHPRFQEIVREQLMARPGATEEEALPFIMEAIVAHAPSGSGIDRHDR